jgi:hypothetical protein
MPPTRSPPLVRHTIQHGLPEDLSAIRDQLTTWRRRAERVRVVGLTDVGVTVQVGA